MIRVLAELVLGRDLQVMDFVSGLLLGGGIVGGFWMWAEGGDRAV